MINFCHIAPVSFLPFVKKYPTHLLLAHLVEENDEYRKFYARLKLENPNVVYHLDNSAFEMFKRGQPMYPSDKLIEMGKSVSADSIVMSDYPKEHWSKTVEAAERLIPQFKKEGFKTFFCPQSEIGQLDDLMQSFTWAINNSDVDFIGVSILACPIALGINESKHEGGESRDDSYRMQRYLSRWAIFRELERRNLLSERTINRFHCLGMTDGPREIDLLRDYHKYIYSWDSSSAIWHAIQRIEYDNTPTGLRYGKCETEVDFDMPLSNLVDIMHQMSYNTDLIDKMCAGSR